MGKYNFDEMGNFYGDRAKKIVENGLFVANDGNWDLWACEESVFSVPIAGSGCEFCFFCSLKNLRNHLIYLRNICQYNPLIPPYWENVNCEYLETFGIA